MLTMKLTLDISKTVEQNAGTYFDAAKKSKKKAEGARKALEISTAKMEKMRMQSVKLEDEEKQRQEKEKLAKKEKIMQKPRKNGFINLGGLFLQKDFLLSEEETQQQMR